MHSLNLLEGGHDITAGPSYCDGLLKIPQVIDKALRCVPKGGLS